MKSHMKSISAKVSLTVLAFLIYLFNVASATQNTLQVPSEYATIQEAIDAASGGDEIVVADGVYMGEGNKDLDFLGKAITVRSENGPDNCIIDCEGSGRGFNFHSGEDNASVVKGFTIRNGYISGEWPQDSGGAISCISSSPTITGNVITDSFAIYSGGAIFCFDFSSPVIESNTITGNSAFLGSGIYCFESSSPLIQSNTITGNFANAFLAGAGGGGISCCACSPTIINNTITDNSADVGGGIDCYHYATPTIMNNVIAGNRATGMGGGIFCYDVSSPIIVNNTIVGNSSIFGSGIFCGHFANATVVNTILWNTRDEVELRDSSVTITYSNVQDGYEGEGNIDAQPKFVSPRGGDYHLRPGSPCIGAGTNVGAPGFDRDGKPRPNPPNSNCDIGAYESPFGQPRGTELAPAMVRKLASTWGKIKQEP